MFCVEWFFAKDTSLVVIYMLRHCHVANGAGGACSLLGAKATKYATIRCGATADYKLKPVGDPSCVPSVAIFSSAAPTTTTSSPQIMIATARTDGRRAGKLCRDPVAPASPIHRSSPISYDDSSAHASFSCTKKTVRNIRIIAKLSQNINFYSELAIA